jgi:hypothetical protein
MRLCVHRGVELRDELRVERSQSKRRSSAAGLERLAGGLTAAEGETLTRVPAFRV